MMNNLEKVEKLIEKANITYEEAAAVLESCDWDMLDAIIKLEAEGKIKTSPSAAEHHEENTSEKVTDSPQQIVDSYQTYQQEQQNHKSGDTWRGIKAWIKKMFRKSCDNRFVVYRKGNRVIEMPVLLLIILLLASVWTILIVMAVGLFFGFSYHFTGPDLGKKNINDAMAKANDVADGIKSEFQSAENNANSK